MKLKLSSLSRRHLLGYMLGTQERELHELLGRLVARSFPTIFNIGAADGYYAIGLALRSPLSHVHAFERDSEYHSLLARSARLNRVSNRVTIHGSCDPAMLRKSLRDAPAPVLIVMDTEGAERELLDPTDNPYLIAANILVETHDAFVPNVTEVLFDRFQRTHTIECYTSLPRSLADFPPSFLRGFKRLFPTLAMDLMDERRTGIQRWLAMTPK